MRVTKKLFRLLPPFTRQTLHRVLKRRRVGIFAQEELETGLKIGPLPSGVTIAVEHAWKRK